MEITKGDRIPSLIGIEYPGRVENVDKMIETLGGSQDLSRAFSENQKLQLKFHPTSYYNKAIISNEPTTGNDSSGILLKMKIRRPKKPTKDSKTEFISAELVGTVSTLYKFNNVADFQYLPIQKNETTKKTECIYNDIVPDDITCGPQWFREKTDMPLFLPPVQFTRTDQIQPTVLRNEQKNLVDEDDDEKIIRFSSRSTRSTNGTTVIFEMNHPVPMKPKEAVKEFATDNNALAQKEFDSIVELFEQRPIWTLSAIRAHIREPPKRISKILACVAFYYTTGPWRNCFVKFGYDPRKNFESRFYQMIDYRVRQGAGFKGELKRKSTSAISKRVKVHQKFDGGLEEDEIDTNYQLRQKEAIFTVDTIPPFRARNYQLIDIQIPKIQEMLKNIPSPITGAECDEKRGWFPQGFLEDVRTILSNAAQSNMMKLCKEKNISLDEFKVEDEDSITNQDIDEDTASSESNVDTSDEDAESD
ncbi:hypothetical protein ACKWTF_001146 [Chironomus riparius]